MFDQSRGDRVLAALGEMGLEQMLITDPMSIYYLTGVYQKPMERFYGLCLRADGQHAFFLNHLFHVPEEVGIEKVWYADTDPITHVIAAHVNPALPLGVDNELKAKILLPLMEQKAATAFVSGSRAVDLTRGVKDAQEQEKMRLASHLNDLAMERFPTLIHAGVTELEVAEQMLQIYLDLGADGYSFSPIVSFGPNAADPHHSPDQTVLQEGDCVLFDVGCIKDGYCSDMTRTFYYKTVSEAHRTVYETVRKANEAAIAEIRPGVPLCHLDQTARGLISEAGYGPYFNHRLGHFIGLSEHEAGDVSSANPQTVLPGMIFSIEPGIYLPGDTGTRVEDLVLVTETGCEVLNHYPKTLQIIE